MQATHHTYDLRSLTQDQFQAIDNQGGGDSFISTFRENDYFLNYNATQ